MKSSMLLSLVALAFVFAPAHAQQPTFAMSGGFSRQSGELDHAWGHTIGLTAVVHPAHRFGARFDLAYHHVGVAGIVIYDCFGPATCRPFPTRTGNSLNVVSATAALVLEEHPHAPGSFYWTAGLGVYTVTESPYDGAYGRPGWSAGGGARVSDRLFIDVRYHQLFRPATFRHLVPITFGFRF